MEKVKVKTPAKINLTLEVLNKRPDGYHEIKSLMQSVSLYDFLTITKQEGTNDITLNGNKPDIPYDENNLCYKSAKIFFEETNLKNQGININIEKRIPVAAGLAGGSTNAAGVLTGLNELYDKPLSINDMSQLAAKIGSDVNFCLHGGTKLATSRGESLQSVSTPEMNVIIIKPKDLSLSTKDIYTKYSELFFPHNAQEEFVVGGPKFQNTDLIINAINDNNIENIALFLSNDLEKVALGMYEQIQEIKNKLISIGCLNAIMSGSGPSVFGIYNTEIDFYEYFAGYEMFETFTIDKGVSIY